MGSIINQFIAEYGSTIIYTVITGIIGYVGIGIKMLITKYINDNRKRAIAKTCVEAVEQICKTLDIHGEEKFKKCAEYVSGLAKENGIEIGETEIKMLIEQAVHTLNQNVNDALKDNALVEA